MVEDKQVSSKSVKHENLAEENRLTVQKDTIQLYDAVIQRAQIIYYLSDLLNSLQQQYQQLEARITLLLEKRIIKSYKVCVKELATCLAISLFTIKRHNTS
jgi:hypothetical protein